MDPQLLLNRTTPKLTPKITKINSLVEVSTKARKSSTKLRKVFEKGTYQKKTQLSVLNRYKRRLDSIQKQNDKRFAKKQRVKLKLPQIKKYVGSFFTGGSDPLKSLAQLAAFNALQKGAKGDILGALGPALVFGGIAFGPSLIKGGINLARRGKAQPQTSAPSGRAFLGPSGSKTVFGGITSRLGRVGSPTGTPGIRPQIGLAARQFEAGAFRQTVGARAAFPVALPGTPSTAERLGGAAQNIANRFGTKGAGVAAEAATARAGKPLAKQALGRFGKAILPGAGAAFSFYSAKERDKSGDKFGSAIDNIAGSLDAFAAGVQIAAAASAATGIGIPAAGLIELAAGVASIGSFGLDMFNLFRDLTGQSDKEAQKNKLKAQTEKQKSVEEKAQGEKLTFQKTLNRYEKVVDKFEKFSRGFTGGMGMTPEQVRQTAARIEDLGGGSTPISAAGYEFTQQGSFSQYLTGDVNAPEGAYDPSHGTSDNYHDHLAFKDPDTAKRAYEFLQSKGITVTELQGVGGGVTSPHSGPGSAHHRGLAFDVPGYQWGSDGLIDERHYRGSAKVRAFMNDFYNLQTRQPQQRQPEGLSYDKGHTIFDMRRDVARSLRGRGKIPFQYNGQTYYLLVDEKFRSSIYKNRDPLGLTREYYDFIYRVNDGLHDAAVRKVNSMFSNAYEPLIAPKPPTPSAPAPAPVQTPSPAPRYIESSTQPQDIVIRYPVIRQVVSTPAQSSQPMISSGPSQQELLNSFYKRVLLNTVA